MDRTKVNFSDFEVDRNALQKYDYTKVKITSNVIKQVAITKNNKYPEEPVFVVLEFVETSHGYRFCGWKLFGEETAIKIAEAIWYPIYGEKIYDKKPFVARLKNPNIKPNVVLNLNSKYMNWLVAVIIR